MGKENRKPYEAPRIEVTQVEIESSICSGSVEFKGDGKGQTKIADQGVADVANNDFFNANWEVPNKPSTEN